jgi:hypothetical protein
LGGQEIKAESGEAWCRCGIMFIPANWHNLIPAFLTVRLRITKELTEAITQIIAQPLKHESAKMSASRLRVTRSLSRQLGACRRSFAASSRRLEAAVPAKSTTETTIQTTESSSTELGQAPNRPGIWAKSQQPRSAAMSGPRFEQTDFSVQVSSAYFAHKVRIACSFTFSRNHIQQWSLSTNSPYDGFMNVWSHAMVAAAQLVIHESL